MKFITSRIISGGQVRSLKEIIADEEKKMQKQEETKTVVASTEKKVKTAATEEKVKKVASKEKPKAAKEKPKVVKAAKEEPKQEDAKEYSVKEVKAAQDKYAQKLGIVWKKLKSEAALSPEDRGFLLEYFKKYYPADYAEALIAQY